MADKAGFPRQKTFTCQFGEIFFWRIRMICQNKLFQPSFSWRKGRARRLQASKFLYDCTDASR